MPLQDDLLRANISILNETLPPAGQNKNYNNTNYVFGKYKLDLVAQISVFQELEQPNLIYIAQISVFQELLHSCG